MGADEVTSNALTGTSTSSAGAPLSASPRQALQKSRASDLFQHYIDALAPWYDLSDGARHFAVQVPVLALDEPLLFHALMALSAMHLAKTMMPSVRPEAEAYHGACIHGLIGLSEAESRLLDSGIALAATCLLRSYEILAGRLSLPYKKCSPFEPITGYLQVNKVLKTPGFVNRGRRPQQAFARGVLACLPDASRLWTVPFWRRHSAAAPRFLELSP